MLRKVSTPAIGFLRGETTFGPFPIAGVGRSPTSGSSRSRDRCGRRPLCLMWLACQPDLPPFAGVRSLQLLDETEYDGWPPQMLYPKGKPSPDDIFDCPLRNSTDR